MKEKIPIYISIFVFILIFILALIIPNINFFKKKNNDDNLDNPFYIKKQILYSGIMPKSTSFYENSFNLSVSQYTDIAIYLGTINSELTPVLKNVYNVIYETNSPSITETKNEII